MSAPRRNPPRGLRAQQQTDLLTGSVGPSPRASREGSPERPASVQSGRSMPGGLPIEDDPTIVISTVPQSPTNQDRSRRSVHRTVVHNESSDDDHEDDHDNLDDAHPLAGISRRIIRNSVTGTPHGLQPILPPIVLGEGSGLQHRQSPISRAIEAINNSNIRTPSVMSIEGPNEQQIEPVIPPPYQQPQWDEEGDQERAQEAQFMRLVQQAVINIIPRITRGLSADNIAAREQITDVRNRLVAATTHMERIDQTLEAHNTRLDTNQKEITKATIEGRRTNESLAIVHTALQAIPELLGELRRIGNLHQETLSELRREAQSTNEAIAEMDERLSLLITERPTEQPVRGRSPSPAPSARTDPFDEEPIGESTRTRTTKKNVNKADIPKEAKAKKPEAFEGKKRDQEADIFLMKMEVYFNEYPGAFNDERKMTTTLSNMKDGNATQWAQPLLQQLLKKTDHPALRSWEAFKESFLMAFGDPIKAERAVRDIQRLVQTGSAQEYAARFRILMDNVEWDEKALIDRFRSGLKDNVRSEMLRSTFMMDTKNTPLERWIELAVRTDDILYATRDRDTPRNNNTFRGKAATETSERRRPTYIKEAEGKLGKEELTRRLKERLCLKCGKKGHRSNTCRSKDWDTKKEKGKAAEVSKEEESTSSESEN